MTVLDENLILFMLIDKLIDAKYAVFFLSMFDCNQYLHRALCVVYLDVISSG